MAEVARIAEQLRRAFEGEAWHGPSVREVLRGVASEQAVRRPAGGAHSILEIVHHLAAWANVVRRRLEGERAETPDEGDFPPDSGATGEADWQAALQRLEESYHGLRGAVAQFDDGRLDEPVIEGMTSAYVTLHGAIQHYLYHAGQIAVLKKI